LIESQEVLNRGQSFQIISRYANPRTLFGLLELRVLQIGGAMSGSIANRARKEMSTNKRYEWLGEQPQSRVRQILNKSSLCVLSSRMEGGANVLSEAIAASVPILACRIGGNLGILGADYPGYFDVGDTAQTILKRRSS
jgi:glycosyltransferase involved in cell wall biosynthesis